MVLRKMALFALSAVFCASVAPQLASAQTTGTERTTSKIVKFEGKTIDLSKSWEEATACLVWDQAGATECFRSTKEMMAQAETLEANNPNLNASCSSALTLYEHSNFGGRVLRFYDRGYWQNLGNYGFNDELSSFKVGACSVHLAEHHSGGGYWYPGSTSAGTWVGGMGGWNDRVSSIYIR